MKVVNFSIILIAIFVLIGCNGIKPEIMKKHINIIIPDDSKVNKQPFVIFFQGTGGHNNRAYKWASWFVEYGIASVIIDNAGARNLRNLRGIHNTNLDLSPTLEVIKNNPKLDLSHYAVMGFSKGGTAVLRSAESLNDKQPRPDFVFSFYPGFPKSCPNSYGKKTKVHVFYGDKDEWGKYKNIIGRCRSMTSWYDNATFHLLKNAHHGYDGDWDGYWSCCGQQFRSKPSKEALNETKKIILNIIQKKWNIKKR